MNFVSVAFRLVLAMLMGGIIGMEREYSGHPAGFRTYTLVALGATVTMILNQYLDFMQTNVWSQYVDVVSRTDASRLGAQVINGVGFLGAGTILVTNKQEITGLTTAAGLWASACLGLACGAGFYECVFFGVLLILICIGIFSKLESRITEGARNMNIYVEIEGMEYIGDIVARLKAENIVFYDVDVSSKPGDGFQKTGVVLSVNVPKRQHHPEVLAMISTVGGVLVVEEI